MSPIDPDLEESPFEMRGKTAYLPDIHRLLPQSPDAEMGVLGSFLLSPREMGAVCISRGVTAAKFHIPQHAEIFTSLAAMWKASQAIDFITLTQAMRNNGKLEDVGGASFITNLFTFIPTAANANYYIDILLEKWTLRRIITGCTEYAARSYDEQDNVPELLGGVQSMLMELTADPRSDDTETSMAENIMSVTERIEGIDAGTVKSGLETGLVDLDEELGGLHDGEVTIIMGSTGGGKTSLAHNIIDHVAVDLGLPVMLFSYEMPKMQVTERLICARAKINTKTTRTGRFTMEESVAYHKACAELKDAPIRIEDNADLSIQRIRARARREMSRRRLSLIVIDYLQKPRSETHKKNNSRQRDVAEVSDETQKMSMELGIPVIALAQINNEGEVREANDIAFDAKTVLKIRRENEKIPIEEESDYVKRLIVITKNNHGPLGVIPVTFLKPFVKFVDYSPQ